MPKPDPETDTPRNRAERRRAEHEKRRKGKRGKFKRTSAAQIIETLKTNIASWEENLEYHELNVDKNELMLDALDEKAANYESEVERWEDLIAGELRAIDELHVSIANAEARIKELQAT